MNHVFRLYSSSSITCYESSLYRGSYICSHCLKRHKIIFKDRRNSSTFGAALLEFFKKRKSNGFTKKVRQKTELVKITNTKTTQTTMPIGKLNASHVTAFAKQPGMILYDLKSSARNVNTKDSVKSTHKSSILKDNLKIYPHYGDERNKNNSSELYDCDHIKKFSKGNSFMSYLNSSQQDYESDCLSSDDSHIAQLRNSYSFSDSSSPLEEIICDEDSGSFKEEAITVKKTKLPVVKQDTSSDVNQMTDSSTTKKLGGDVNLNASVKNAMLNEKTSNFNTAIYCYVDVCVHSNLLDLAYSQLKPSLFEYKTITSPEIFNCLIEGYSEEKNLVMVQKIMESMKDFNVTRNARTYVLCLECINRLMQNKSVKTALVSKVLQEMSQEGFSINDLLTKTCMNTNQRQNLLCAIRLVHPYFKESQIFTSMDASSPLLAHLYRNKTKIKSPYPYLTKSELNQGIQEQISNELNTICHVKSVHFDENEAETSEASRIIEEVLSFWKKNFQVSLAEYLVALRLEAEADPTKLTLYPYLICIPLDVLTEVMVREARSLCLNSDFYSSSVILHYIRLGFKVWQNYVCRKKLKNQESLDSFSRVLSEYCDWFRNPSGPAKNSRQEWQYLLEDNPDVKIFGEKVIPWPREIKYAIGELLYSIIFKSALVPCSLLKKTSTSKSIPAFYLIVRYTEGKTNEEIKTHPLVSSLFRAEMRKCLFFNTDELPMLCPPKPWYSVYSGGYLILPTTFVRFPMKAPTSLNKIHKVPPKRLYAVFDSLNQLQTIPWKVNEPVLDVVLEVFRSGGSIDLEVPVKPDLTSIPEFSNLVQSSLNRYEAYLERMNIRKERHDELSLWCEALYRLSLANHFRKKIIWLPQNIDFRGRVYPVPPHFNHLSSDLYRSLLLFAKTEKLGVNGLNWLKIHCINLSGILKRKSNRDRLELANQMLPEIIDSATNPLQGEKWWKKVENPWQTLATCMEIRKVLEHGKCEEYETSFPVHQDGSCNGLQHYAALGRDVIGAASVNLSPANEPQDVYSVICNIVEESRKKDAENGVRIAKVLEGIVTRKVVKQTVMTTVYGVTLFGAKMQIAGQLKDIGKLEENQINEAAFYLAKKVFSGLNEMFYSAKEIQDWFINCAKYITKYHEKPVEWISPLGLPVVQPYFKSDSLRALVPNSRKQMNAFAPNFVHSLDSSHMMLTSLFCEQAGLTFAAVHDCYWTHPSTVDIMNKICRETFISLHSQDILNDLSKFFSKMYTNSDSVTKSKESIFQKVPETGRFNLNEVRNSEYFFS